MFIKEDFLNNKYEIYNKDYKYKIEFNDGSNKDYILKSCYDNNYDNDNYPFLRVIRQQLSDETFSLIEVYKALFLAYSYTGLTESSSTKRAATKYKVICVDEGIGIVNPWLNNDISYEIHYSTIEQAVDDKQILELLSIVLYNYKDKSGISDCDLHHF